MAEKTTRKIDSNVERRLLAESMGRCMNPKCNAELFRKNGDIIEKAHIVPYCETADNTYENLVVLCPNCHTDFDKNSAYTPEEVLNWKRIRQRELKKFFEITFTTFDELKEKAVPLLRENKTIFENYFLKDNKTLWDKFTPQILSNNLKLKSLFQSNMGLFQKSKQAGYSNQELVSTFLLHIDEFENTRLDDEKMREVFFPAEINSIFGIAPVQEALMNLTESLENLITKLLAQKRFEGIWLGIDKPYFKYLDDNGINTVFLDDTPRLRQLFNDFKCFRNDNFNLKSLNFALKYIKDCDIDYEFINVANLREIKVRNKTMIFVYAYCLSIADLKGLSLPRNSVVVNLHGWNAPNCISKEAYEYANTIGMKLLTVENGGSFYNYINEIK